MEVPMWRPEDGPPDYMERATNLELALQLEEIERQMKVLREYAHQIRNEQQKRMDTAWKAIRPV